MRATLALALSLATVALAVPTQETRGNVLEQGTICTGDIDAPIEEIVWNIDTICAGVTKDPSERLPHAIPELNAWLFDATVKNRSVPTKLVAIDGDAKWENCRGSYQAIINDCSKDGKAAYGMRRYGNELYIIAPEVPDIPELTGQNL